MRLLLNMGEPIFTLPLFREKGFLYYVGTDADGYLTVFKAVMARHGRTKKNKEVVVTSQ